MRHERVLVIDDEAMVRTVIRKFLTANGYVVEEAGTAAEAVEAFRTNPPDLAICDYELPDGNGISLLPAFKALEPATPVLMLTGHGTIELAVRAIKEGAEQFLTKPVDLHALRVIVDRLLEQRRVSRRHIAGENHPRGALDPFVGTSPAIRGLERDARKVAESDSTVLIQGETGSGKGVLARWLHENGPRGREAFLDINCAGLAGDLLESELFGYAQGAFAGAVTAKMGLFELAHHGTVFLDEIADVDSKVQPKLMKVLDERKFRRLGDIRDRVVDVRLITSTHQDLASLVRSRMFRNDLYFRVNTVPITVPPLRARVEDIPHLAAQMLERLAVDLGRPKLSLSDDAERALEGYGWPGNVRELRNVLERAALLSSQPVLDRGDLRLGDGERASVSSDAGLTLPEVERRYIMNVLRETRGQLQEAADRLGIPRSALDRKMKKHSIDLAQL